MIVTPPPPRVDQRQGVAEGGRPLPLARLGPARLAALHGVFTDVDDTLTVDGKLDPAAHRALDLLYAAGVPVIAITGRPMGWSQPFALEWPVAAIVAENGAVALMRDGTGLRTEYAQDEATRARNTLRLNEVAQRILRELPGVTLAQDSPGRVTDIAVDHSEFAHLDGATTERVLALMREEGMTASVSSIHINGWFGPHDKWSGACWMTQRLLGRDLAAEVERWVYVGDSTNDQVMFGRFPLSVGVANLMRFADQLHTWPAFITDGERGAGFAEVANAVLAVRAAGEFIAPESG